MDQARTETKEEDQRKREKTVVSNGLRRIKVQEGYYS